MFKSPIERVLTGRMLSKLKLSTQVFVLVSILLACELSFIAALGSLLNASEQEAQREKRARVVAGHLNNLLRVIVDRTSGVWMKGWNDFIHQAGIVRIELNEHVPEIRELVAKNPDERAAFEEIESMIKKGSFYLGEMQKLSDAGRTHDARQFIIPLQPLIQNLSPRIKDMLAEQKRVEEESPKIQEQNRESVKRLLIGGVGLNILLALTLAWMFNRSTTRRLKLLMDNSVRLASNQPLNPPLDGNDETAALDSVFREMARALESASRRVRVVIENAADIICTIDDKSCISTISPSVKAVLNLDADEVIGMRVAELLDRDEAPVVLETIDQIKRNPGDQIEPFESKLRCKDGSFINVLWSVQWYEADRSLICVVHDITKRKQAELLMQEAEARLRKILESIPIGLALINQCGKIELVNPTLKQMLGETEPDLISTNLTDILKLADLTSAVELQTIFDRASSRPWEMALANSDGSVNLPVDVSITGIELMESQKFIALITDVRERHEIERLKQEFVSMVSHDLRTPLTAVQNFLELLSSGVYEISEPAKTKLPALERSVDRLINLVRDLLDLDRLELGKLQLKLTQVSIDDVIQRSVESVDTVANQRKIKIETPDEEVATTLLADRDRLVQVLVNLLSNAIKFSPEKETITVCADRTDQQIKIQVVDRGRGVPPEFKEAIFERFKQVASSDSHEKGGIGLGLPICRAIINEHGGEIGVESEDGKGSCFWFTLPIRSA